MSGCLKQQTVLPVPMTCQMSDVVIVINSKQQNIHLFNVVIRSTEVTACAIPPTVNATQQRQ